jgi:anaerobic selenocysteine-containing dehydrogenase
VRSFCRFCEALCGIEVTVENDRVVSIRGDRSDPLSHGYTCPKGRALPYWHHHPDRLDAPALRRDGTLTTVAWDELLDDLSARLLDVIDRHGRDAVGVYIATGVAFDANGRRTVERMQRSLGTKSKYTATTIDTPGKLLVSEMMSGHPGLVPAPDREDGSLFIFLGTNPVVSHGHLNAFPDPVVTIRGLAAEREVWVVDPRRTETARLANRHIQIRPGSDFALLAFLVRDLLADGADEEYLAKHAAGVEELREAVAPWDANAAAARTGLGAEELASLADAIRRHGRISGQSGTGVAMSATANIAEWLLWALHIVTGSFDRPGGMWFNPGYLKRLETRVARSETTEARPGPGAASRPDIPGRWGEIPCAAMADEIEAGHLRALIVAGGNPPLSFPDSGRISAALVKLEVLAVADVVETETTRLATHVLPVAGQLERSDMPLYIDQFMPSVSTRYTPAVVPPGADRRPLWKALSDLGERMGIAVLPPGVDLDTANDDDLLAVVADRSRSSFAHVTDAGVDVDAPSVFGWVLEGVLPDGRWQLAPEPLVGQLAAVPPADPVVLIPRRQVRHLNSQMAVPEADGRVDLPELLVNPDDAASSGIADGAKVTVTASAGSLVATARHDEAMVSGAVSLPHGFAEPNVGALTSSDYGVDELSGMVLQSGIPVGLDPVEEQ